MMPNHEELFPEGFNPADAAAAFLAQPFFGDGMEEITPDEQARIDAEIARRRVIIDDLAARGVDLGIGENQTLETKTDEVRERIDRIHDRWNAIVMRHDVGDVRESDEATFAKLREEEAEAKTHAELLDLTYLVVSPIVGNEVMAQTPEELGHLIADIATSLTATDAQKFVLLNALKGIVGSESYLNGSEYASTSGVLEQALGRLAATEQAGIDNAKELRTIQTTLINELGVGNTGHEDWLPFSRKLLEAKLRQDGSAPATLAHVLRQIHKFSTRLGIDPSQLTRILDRFGITE